MKNNKKQTAVEFYLDKVFDIIGDDILDELSIEQINKIHDLSLQAKEIEKQQRSIKLPSDEEIREVIKPFQNEMDDFDLGFRNGVQWLREKIQGGEQ
jgi:hypothetical protein